MSTFRIDEAYPPCVFVVQLLDNSMMGFGELLELHIGHGQVCVEVFVCFVFNLAHGMHDPHYTPQSEDNKQSSNFNRGFSESHCSNF